jgi:hypothetical protein
MGAEATFSGTEVSPVSKRAHASKVETKGLMIWLRSLSAQPEPSRLVLRASWPWLTVGRA